MTIANVLDREETAVTGGLDADGAVSTWYLRAARDDVYRPSGSANRPLPPTRNQTPTGATRWTVQQLVPFSVPLAFVILPAAGGPTGAAVRSSNNVDRSAAVAERLGPVRRPGDDEDESSVHRPVTASTVMVESVTAGSGAGAETVASAVVITAADQVHGIQDVLSLTVTQVAEIVGVSRATVYAWIKAEVELPRDTATVQRLRKLHNVATLWRELSPEHLGRLVVAPVSDTGSSLFALLTAHTWDMAAVADTMGLLAERLAARAEERRALRARGDDQPRIITAENIELERLRLRGLE